MRCGRSQSGISLAACPRERTSGDAIRRLIGGGNVHTIGLGIAVVAFAIVVNVVVSTVLSRKAKASESPALEGDAAHLRTDALTSFGVLIALALVHLTGAQRLDPAVALVVSAAILQTSVRLIARSSRELTDHTLPPEEVESIRAAIEEFGPRGVVGYHELRTRRAGSRRYVDLHVQFRSGTSLEDAHLAAHALQDLIADGLQGAGVLIHLEPEDRVRSGEVLPPLPPQRAEAAAPSSAT